MLTILANCFLNKCKRQDPYLNPCRSLDTTDFSLENIFIMAMPVIMVKIMATGNVLGHVNATGMISVVINNDDNNNHDDHTV